CTPATATLSEALAVTVIVPETGALPSGEVIATVGGVVSEVGGGPFETVTSTMADSPILPALSCARACKVCGPFPTVCVSHSASYGAVVSRASSTPSRRNCTTATPEASDAAAFTVTTPETVCPFPGSPMLTVAGVLSTRTVTGADTPLLPAASRATAVSVCCPSVVFVVSHDTENQFVVSSIPRSLPSSLNCTPTTPTLSDASALTVIVPATIAPAVGDAIATVGGILSLKTGTWTWSELHWTPRMARATGVRLCHPWLVA